MKVKIIPSTLVVRKGHCLSSKLFMSGDAESADDSGQAGGEKSPSGQFCEDLSHGTEKPGTGERDPKDGTSVPDGTRKRSRAASEQA